MNNVVDYITNQAARITVVIDPTLSKSGEYNSTTRKVSLQNDSEFVLFEELFHVHQMDRYPASYSKYGGNIEIEAKMAFIQYMINMEYGQDNIFGPGWDEMKIFIKNPIEDNWKYAVDGLRLMNYPADKYPVSSYSEFKTSSYDAIKCTK